MTMEWRGRATHSLAPGETWVIRFVAAATAGVVTRKALKVYLNETAPRWERRRPRSSPVDLSNSRHPHHILPPLNEPLHAGNVPVPGRACVGLVLLLLRVSSRLSKPPLLPARPIYSIRANRMPPRGFVQEPVPERPRRLAVESSSAPRPFGYRLLPWLILRFGGSFGEYHLKLLCDRHLWRDFLCSRHLL